ncbi:hypothetical protein [Klebsiella quasipneumoniae]|uniref:hypothetical protein n=1 Tax=Klebsiella quasipneumoniae TaxID=1463165 RepID=UPI00396B36A4
MAHDVPLGCAPDEYDDLISGTCSHLPYVTKAAEPKLYGLIPLGGSSTVSDAICAGANPTPASKTCDALSKKAGRC